MAQQDIRRACDTVWWSSLEKGLQRVGRDPQFENATLLGDMWQDRQAQVATNRGLTLPFPFENGLAQGGVLSPPPAGGFLRPPPQSGPAATGGVELPGQRAPSWDPESLCSLCG